MIQTFPRRHVVVASAALALPACTTTSARTPPSCLMPVRASADRVIRTVAGLRPYRPGGFVVRAEALGTKRLVHNYGHGGSGVTMSWGTAKLAVEMGVAGHSGPVAVIGAGIVGLSTARLVQEGMFATSRNPLYVGNILVLVGLFVIHNNPLAYVLGGAFFLISYHAIVAAAERYLRGQFGQDYEDYCRRENRWLPDPIGIDRRARHDDLVEHSELVQQQLDCGSALLYTLWFKPIPRDRGHAY